MLDVTFRVYPKLARRLPVVERFTSLAHGLSAGVSPVVSTSGTYTPSQPAAR